MQSSATIKTSVDDDALTTVILSKNISIHITITCITHAPNVNITETTIRKTIHYMCAMFYPAFIKHFILRTF